MGVHYVIVGHSERRKYFQEDNILLAKKIASIVTEGLTPIYCIGETLEERESKRWEAVIEKQIVEGLVAFKQVAKKY